MSELSSELSDDDSHELYLQERFDRLGFYPQKERFCNNYLPYANKLDDESQEMLINIKNCLAKAVAMREIKPNIEFFVNKLLE